MEYKKFSLDNGLQVIVHEDRSVKTAVLNILYNVGSKDEDADKTGFAHLFEHLMFGGSVHIHSYDEALQRVGGENNAFTTPDFTNYYISVPSINLETAFWLESDRMLGLAFDPESLAVQRKVVIEEFKQGYLDRPYGDVFLHLKPLAYQFHPYRWNTIGKEIKHIEDATMADVKSFFAKFYTPNNAILVVAGDVSFAQVEGLANKWFAPIAKGNVYHRSLPIEPVQNQARHIAIEGKVPLNAFYKAYHIPSRVDAMYQTVDLLGNILGGGDSSRLYDVLVQTKGLLQSVSAGVTGSVDPGLLVIAGKLKHGVAFAAVEDAVELIIADLTISGLYDGELGKVKMYAESAHVFAEVELLNRAMSLAYYTMLGNTEEINRATIHINAVTEVDIINQARQILRKENCTTVHYHAVE